MNRLPPREYLLRVLGRWQEFCKTHRRFEKAIRDILAENERLKNEIKELKGKQV